MRTHFQMSTVLVVLCVTGLAGPALAKDPGVDAYMIRMMSCTGPDATMEVYIPEGE
jgi:hypothetical protein